MCFSAQVSFLAGGGLTAFGVYLLKLKHKPQEKFFLAIPLMFGIQQLFEGVVWVTQLNPALAQQNMLARYGFLFFAFFVWPVWIPFSMLQMEKTQGGKRCISALLGAGAVVATSLAWVSLTMGVSSAISCNHIEYVLDLPQEVIIPGLIWYWVATLVPFFVIKRKYMKELGAILLASALVSLYFYSAWFTSVWCFFAALLSVIIYKVHTSK